MNQRQKELCRLLREGMTLEEAGTQCGYRPGYFRKLLRIPEVRAAIEEGRRPVLSHGPDQVLLLYERIAFSDIKDFLRFGTREEEGKRVSYTELREDREVDGQLVEEIVISSRGAPRVKLADRMKALEKLERYFDLFPDVYRRALMERKLELMRRGEQVIEVVTSIPRPEEEEGGTGGQPTEGSYPDAGGGRMDG